MAYYISIGLAAILSIVYLFSYRISKNLERWHEYIISIGSGMVITVIFVEVLPDLISEGVKFLSANAIALSIFGGLVGYHLIEKYTYKHSSKTILRERLGYLHVVGFIIDNFLEGFVLVLIFGLTQIDNFVVLVLFIPLLLGDIAASTTLKHLDDRFNLGFIGIAFVSSTVLLGALTAMYLNLSGGLFYSAVGIITGVFLYFVTRDELPRGRKGKPLVFLLAILFTLALFYLTGRVA